MDESPHSPQEQQHPHNRHEQHHHHHHRVSPSFTDSAIDVKEELLTESYDSSSSNTTTTPNPHHNDDLALANRISRIAHLAAAPNSPFRNLDVDKRGAVEDYLGGLERLLLLDPRPRISREIAENRPTTTRTTSRRRKKSTSCIISPTETMTTSTLMTASTRGYEDGDSSPANRTTIQQTSHALTVLLDEVSRVNAEVQQRRIESRHIHDLFTSKCEGMAQRIIELENEVHELRSDILEDTIELEGLRGTVRGLESWIGRWQRQREAAIPPSSSSILGSSSTSSPQSKSRWKRKKKYVNNRDMAEEEEDNENDFDTLLDGISAWMRGWNDVEEGFRIRARRRKMRRDRQSQLFNSNNQVSW